MEHSLKERAAQQAGIALRACVLILEQAMRPRNCLRILVLAASTGNQRLLARSAAVALLHFRQAVMEDRAGLLMLPKEVLGTLLAHDCLQVRKILFLCGAWHASLNRPIVHLRCM